MALNKMSLSRSKPLWDGSCAQYRVLRSGPRSFTGTSESLTDVHTLLLVLHGTSVCISVLSDQSWYELDLRLILYMVSIQINSMWLVFQGGRRMASIIRRIQEKSVWTGEYMPISNCAP